MTDNKSHMADIRFFYISIRLFVILGIVLLAVFFSTRSVLAVTQASELSLPVLYLEQVEPQAPVLSNILPPPTDSGLRGVELGIADNNTTGKFLNHRYQMHSLVSESAEKLLAEARRWVETGNGLIVANLPAETLLALMALPQIQDNAIVFNAGSSDDRLRRRQCQPYLLHTLPSRAMLSDALIQFLIKKRWNRWLLIQGGKPRDQLLVNAFQRSAKRFGGTVIDTKTWRFDTDLRRSAQQEMPLFTQTKPYHVTLVADELGDIGEYVLYNTWHPRPVAGSQGLQPVGWHRVVEQWGGAQLQNRFIALTGRWMNSKDYAAWIAVRALGEAVTRTGSDNVNRLYTYLLSDTFEVAGFKGRTLSFRQWNGQLRQPVPLVHARALVSQSPQEGFLHPHTDLDTLGFDRAETQCRFN